MRTSRETRLSLQAINRELAQDIMELENLHKPIDLAHQVSRRNFKEVADKMRRMSVLAIRSAQHLDRLQEEKDKEDKEDETTPNKN